MAGCLIESGIDINCEDLRRVGGVNKTFYAYNLDDLATPEYTFDMNGYITAINFNTYAGLYEFTGKKKSHSAGYTIQSQAGANTYFQHDATVKLFPDTPMDDQVIEDLIVSDVGVIVETNNEEFFLYGGTNGMEVTEGTQNSGSESASDVSDSLTFTGEEPRKPFRILVNDSYDDTKAYLESLVV